MTKPYLLDRGRYGFAVRFNGAFDSAMPDEATARKVAAVDDLLDVLEAALSKGYQVHKLDTDPTDAEAGLWLPDPLADKLRAALAMAKGEPRKTGSGGLIVDDTGECMGCG